MTDWPARIIDGLKRLFGLEDPPGLPPSRATREFEAYLEARRRSDEEYRQRYRWLIRRGDEAAQGLNRVLGLPLGTIVFDDSELHDAYERSRERSAPSRAPDNAR